MNYRVVFAFRWWEVQTAPTYSACMVDRLPTFGVIIPLILRLSKDTSVTRSIHAALCSATC